MNIVDRIISPNIWDEVWEVGGLTSNGLNDDTQTNTIRSKNFIPINNANYYYGKTGNLTTSGGARWYDINKNFISLTDADGNSGIFNGIHKPPTNAYYLRFVSPQIYGNTYKHDICINKSNPSINGKYFPYVMYKRYDMVDLIHTHNLWIKTVKYNQLRAPLITPTFGTFSRNIYTITNLENIGYNQNRLNSTINAKQNHRYLLMTIINPEKSGSSFISDWSSSNNRTILDPVKFYVINEANTDTLIAYITTGKVTGQTEVRLGLPTSNNSAIGDKIEVKLFVIIDLTDWFNNDIPQALLDNPSTFNQYWDGELPYDTGTDVLPNNSIKRLKIGG